MRGPVVLYIAIALLLLLTVRQYVCLERPNIIFFLVDDLGWNDVSFHGSLQIPTPNIDTLAYSGVILNNYYVQPICSPSRGALMTGKYPIRIGMQHSTIAPSQPWGLPLEEMLLPQYLKQLGYATHGIGKWHLGFFHKDYIPTNRGFDSFFGHWSAKEDYFTHFDLAPGTGFNGLDFHEDSENAWNYTGYYGTQAFTDRAKTIIKNHNSSNNPLFLYLPHQAVHIANAYDPLQAPEEYINKFSHIEDEERRKLAGMVSVLDESVGEIFTALDDADMLKNSIIVFTTDNGGEVKGMENGSTGSNWPLRGTKYNLWEGGVRGAAFVWSPLLPYTKGYISENLMHISDWLPTLYAAAGGDTEELCDIDGHNMWPSFHQNSVSPRDHILLNIDEHWKIEGIRKGRYKLIKGSYSDGVYDGWYDKEGNSCGGNPCEDTYGNSLNNIYQRELSQSVIGQYYLKELQVPALSNLHLIEDISKVYPHFLAPAVEVHCGVKLESPDSNCQPLNASCLFDIESDPCEYNNLANSLPKVVQELEDLLNMYRDEAVPIGNRPSDPRANPANHGGAWVSWIE